MPFPTGDEDATEDAFRDECAEETTLVGGVLMSPESEAGGRLDFVHSVYKSTSVPFVGKYIGFVGDKTTAGDAPPPALVVVATTMKSPALTVKYYVAKEDEDEGESLEKRYKNKIKGEIVVPFFAAPLHRRLPSS